MGLALQRIEVRLGILRPQRTEIMLNLDGLTRSSIEARIDYLINQRVEAGDSRQFAEVQVVRTDEGRALWARARKLRMAQDADSAPGSTFSRTAASLIGPQATLENLIAQRMSNSGESRDNAERTVIHTSEGLELWERIRGLNLSECRDED